MHMIKSRFPDYVRAQHERAQGNEALCIILAHNLHVLFRNSRDGDFHFPERPCSMGCVWPTRHRSIP